MAVTPTVGDIIQVTIGQTLYAQQLLNVLHYRISAIKTVGQTTLDEIANGLYANYYNADGAMAVGFKMLDMQSADLSHDWMRVQKILPLRYVYSQVGGAKLGSLVNPARVTNQVLTITKQTNIAKRWGRGAFFVGGIPNNTAIEGAWGPDLVAEGQSLGNAICTQQILPAGVATLIPVIGNLKNPPAEWLDLLSSVAHSTVRVMRRRTVGVGI